VVTAAVGLGYVFGLQWIFLPIAWLLGDLIFWRYFPQRINAFGHRTRVNTISEILSNGLSGTAAIFVSILSALIIIVCLAGYTSAQWLAGQKFIVGVFAIPDYMALGMFAITIIIYSGIGGFRGSIYVDTFQALIRVGGTVLALVAIFWSAYNNQSLFISNLRDAGLNFLLK